MIISIDGTLASGKSTISSLLTKDYDFKKINTGIYFRIVTYYYLKNKKKINKKNSNYIKKILENNIPYSKLFAPIIDKNISFISNLKYIRKIIYIHLRSKLKKISNKNIILEGRDVFFEMKKYLNYSFFLTAKFNIRLKRRISQLEKKDKLEAIKYINERERNDIGLFKDKINNTKEIIKIDNSDLSVKQTIKLIINYLNLNK